MAGLKVRVLQPLGMMSADGLLYTEPAGFKLQLTGSIGAGLREFKPPAGAYPLILGGLIKATAERANVQHSSSIVLPPGMAPPNPGGSFEEALPPRELFFSPLTLRFGALVPINVFSGWELVELPRFSPRGITALLLGASAAPEKVLEVTAAAGRPLHDAVGGLVDSQQMVDPGVVLIRQVGSFTDAKTALKPTTSVWRFPLRELPSDFRPGD